jgi:hypothetical protein
MIEEQYLKSYPSMEKQALQLTPIVRVLINHDTRGIIKNIFCMFHCIYENAHWGLDGFEG